MWPQQWGFLPSAEVGPSLASVGHEEATSTSAGTSALISPVQYPGVCLGLCTSQITELVQADNPEPGQANSGHLVIPACFTDIKSPREAMQRGELCVSGNNEVKAWVTLFLHRQLVAALPTCFQVITAVV